MLAIILAIEDPEKQELVAGIYNEYSKKLYKEAEDFVENKYDAEDCVQDVVFILIDYLEQYKQWSVPHQKNFLFKCVRCMAINKYHNNQRRYENEFSISDTEDGYDFEIPDMSVDIVRDYLNKETMIKLMKLLDELRPEVGDILYFRCFLGMKNAEIAERLNVSENYVSVTLRRGRQMLIKKGGAYFEQFYR